MSFASSIKSDICSARRLRRRSLFALGLGGGIKVKVAKWVKNSLLRC